eukprot:gene9795-biopygen3143
MWDPWKGGEGNRECDNRKCGNRECDREGRHWGQRKREPRRWLESEPATNRTASSSLVAAVGQRLSSSRSGAGNGAPDPTLYLDTTSTPLTTPTLDSNALPTTKHANKHPPVLSPGAGASLRILDRRLHPSGSEK